MRDAASRVYRLRWLPPWRRRELARARRAATLRAAAAALAAWADFALVGALLVAAGGFREFR